MTVGFYDGNEPIDYPFADGEGDKFVLGEAVRGVIVSAVVSVSMSRFDTVPRLYSIERNGWDRIRIIVRIEDTAGDHDFVFDVVTGQTGTALTELPRYYPVHAAIPGIGTASLVIGQLGALTGLAIAQVVTPDAAFHERVVQRFPPRLLRSVTVANELWYWPDQPVGRWVDIDDTTEIEVTRRPAGLLIEEDIPTVEAFAEVVTWLVDAGAPITLRTPSFTETIVTEEREEYINWSTIDVLVGSVSPDYELLIDTNDVDPVQDPLTRTLRIRIENTSAQPSVDDNGDPIPVGDIRRCLFSYQFTSGGAGTFRLNGFNDRVLLGIDQVGVAIGVRTINDDGIPVDRPDGFNPLLSATTWQVQYRKGTVFSLASSVVYDGTVALSQIPGFTPDALAVNMIYSEKTTNPTPEETFSVEVGGSYADEDSASRALITTEIREVATIADDLILEAGYNLNFSVIGSTLTLEVPPGGGLGAGQDIPLTNDPADIPDVALEFAGDSEKTVINLFGASPVEGEITLVAGDGVEIIPEPGFNRVTILLGDPSRTLREQCDE